MDRFFKHSLLALAVSAVACGAAVAGPSAELPRDLPPYAADKPLPVPDGSYGGVVSSGLFTHGHVGAEALEPVLAATRTGGLLAFTIYATIWRRGGFERTLAELEAAGRIETIAHEQAAHFTRLKGQTVHVLAVRKRG